MPLGTAFEWACTTLVFSSLFEVLIVTWVKRIGFRPYLRVAENWCVGKVVKAEESVFPFLVLAFRSKYPSTLSIMLPILVFYPR